MQAACLESSTGNESGRAGCDLVASHKVCKDKAAQLCHPVGWALLGIMKLICILFASYLHEIYFIGE